MKPPSGLIFILLRFLLFESEKVTEDNEGNEAEVLTPKFDQIAASDFAQQQRLARIMVHRGTRSIIPDEAYDRRSTPRRS